MTSTPTERHLEEAMNWLLLLDQGQTDGDLRQQHQAWLASDPLHALAWRQARRGWMMLDKTEPATRALWPQPRLRASPGKPRLLAGRRRPVVWIAAAAACLAVAIAPVLGQYFGADHMTSTAEIRHITLQDGSQIQLAPDSALSASLTEQSRNIELTGGRAFFMVAKDAARPFVVRAGDTSVTALGTAFDVRMNQTSVLVAVREGRVAVRQPAPRKTGAAPVDETLTAGNQLLVDRATGAVVAQLVPEDAVGSWAAGQLSALNAPVADVVSEIRRYHRGWIVIADDRLGAERVTGLYNLRQPDLALKALLQPIGGSMRQISPFLTILSQSENNRPEK